MSRIRTNIITNRMANGAPTVSNGLVVSGVTTTSDINVGAGVTLNVYGGATYSGVVTATSFVGSGANLTGIDATKIITGNTQVQTIDTGSDGHVKVTTEGSERLRITSDGKFGFGNSGSFSETTMAEFTSSVGGGAIGANITIRNSSTNSVNNVAELRLKTAHGVARFHKYNTGETYLSSHSGGASDLILEANGASNLRVNTNSAERLRIGSAGQLGIAGANYGTSGQVLTSQGASSPIQWATLTTGKVLQMTYKRGGVTSSSNSGGWTDSVESGLNVDITPLSATSRIIIQMHSVGGNTSSGRSYFLRLRRKVNNTGDTNVASFQIGDGSNGGMQSLALTHVDYDASSPFNTSHVRNYRIRFGQDGSGTARFDYATTSVLYCLEIQ